ncbi:hypothetical protein QBC36DRAFT_214295, partial [Triangularia setosa]
MAETDDTSLFQEDDHRVAYIFTPPPTIATSTTSPTTTTKATVGRPAKRRRVSKNSAPSQPPDNDDDAASQQQQQQQQRPPTAGDGQWPRLFNGTESPQAANLRKETFESAWPVLERQIRTVLRDANWQTLNDVVSFFNSTSQNEEGKGRIPAGFIITGPNIAGQDLLFGQLGEALTQTTG